MAFHFFLSLLPLLVFAGYVVGLVAKRRGVEAVLAPILDNLPGATETLVQSEVERLAAGNGHALGPLAFFTFSWIAAGGVHGSMNAIENVVGTARRSWPKKRLLALVWVLASLAGFAVASYGVVKWDGHMHPRPPRVVSVAAAANAPSLPHKHRAPVVRPAGEKALGLGLAGVVATAVLAGFYRFSVRRTAGAARRVWPGAVAAMVAWLAISSAFAFYVQRLSSYATFYGSTATVAVLLVWLWLTSLAILVGAELNAQLEGLRD